MDECSGWQGDDVSADTLPAIKRLKLGSAVNGNARVATPVVEHRMNDFYDEVCLLETSETVYDSWLRPNYVFSCTDQTVSSKSVEEQPPLNEEITCLTKQLAQVKRRLAPAAEQCAKACNARRGVHDAPTNSHLEFIRARRACNPMECLGEGRHGGMNTMFINRSAIKLANVDATLGFVLTLGNYDKPFRFVDLCGAPGGFSEYLLHRCVQNQVPCTFGYGMSLDGLNENGKGLQWKIEEGAWIECGQLHLKYTICRGVEGAGDIFNWNDVVALKELIQRDSFDQAEAESSCVQLVVADGGVDAQREQENQEEVTQKLVLCQVAAALELLRRHGKFVLKAFGFQTTTMRSIMSDLSSRFEFIRIIKPISSRPASAERYVVFQNFNGRPPGWCAKTWKNGILLGSPKTALTHAMALYLNEIDRDLLQLNLKACFAILTHLEEQCRSDAFCEEASFELSCYRNAWRLR